jgi:ArsR family transcriptional regulator, arsenate/arsenite/antimonite-responsive transcriptional repressor
MKVEMIIDMRKRFDISTKIESLEVEHMHAKVVIRALGALAQEHRLAAFRALIEAGEGGLSAGTLAETLHLPNSSLSFHLAQLTNAGLIRQQRQGRSLIYSADYAAMNGLMGYLTENCCAGAACAPDPACSISQERHVA